jgi:hypothetical protein
MIRESVARPAVVKSSLSWPNFVDRRRSALQSL